MRSFLIRRWLSSFIALLIFSSGAVPDTHPRVLVNPSDKTVLYNKILNTPANAHLNAFYNEMLANNSSYQDDPTGYVCPEEDCFEQRVSYGKYASVAFAAWLEDNNVWKDNMINVAQTMTRETTSTSTLHYIHAAGPYLLANALIYDFCYDRLDAIEKQDLIDNIWWSLQLIENDFKNIEWSGSYFKYNNWRPLIDVPYIIGALAIAGDSGSPYTTSMLTADLAIVEENMFDNQFGTMKYMFGDNGTYLEGQRYFRVNFGKTFLLLQALSNYYNTDYYQIPVVKDALSKVSEWMASIMLPNRTIASFSKNNYMLSAFCVSTGNGPGAVHANLLAIAEKYNDGLARWVFDTIFDDGSGGFDIRGAASSVHAEIYIPSLISYTNQPPTPPDINGLETFLDYKRGLLVWRTGWENEDVMFTIESNPVLHNGEMVVRHSRPDKGSITLSAYGNSFIYDPGGATPIKDITPPYNNYPAGINNYIEIDIGHPNIIFPSILGGNHVVSQGFYLSNGEISDYESYSFFNEVKTDNTENFNKVYHRTPNNQAPYDVYDENSLPPADPNTYWINTVEKAERRILYFKEEDHTPPYFWVIDNFVKDSGTSYDYYFQLHTKASNNISYSGRLAEIKESGTSWPKLDIYSIHPSSPSYNSQYISTAGNENTVRRLSIIKNNSLSGFYNTLLVPVKDHNAGTNYPTNYSDLTMTSGSGTIISWSSNYDDYCMYSENGGLQSPSISSDAEQAFLRKNNSNGNWEKLFLLSGSTFTINSQQLIDLYGQSGRVVSDGQTVKIYGSNVSQLKVYAPDAIALELNDQPIAFYRVNDYIYAGDIVENLNWSGFVFISGSVSLPQGNILNISPGTVVEFDLNARMYVYGKLIAQGISGNPIIFTSSQTTPAPGDWGGVTFYDSADDNSIIQYVNMEYMHTGLWLNNASPTVSNSTLRYSNLYNLRLDYSNATIANNVIENSNLIAGIYSRYSDAVIDANYIQENGQDGIYLYQSNPHIINNEITGNERYGVYCDYYSSPEFGSSTTLHGNNVLTNNDIALYAYSTADPFLGLSIGTKTVGGFNSIYNNETFAVKALYSSTVLAERNWWGEYPIITFFFYSDETSEIDWSPALSYDPAENENISIPADELSIANKATSLQNEQLISTLLKQARELRSKQLFRPAISIYKRIINELSTHSTAKIGLLALTSTYREAGVDSISMQLHKTKRNNPNIELRRISSDLLTSNYLRNNEIDSAITQAEQNLNIFADGESEKLALFDLFNIYFVDIKDYSNAEMYLARLKNLYPDDPLTMQAQLIWGTEQTYNPSTNIASLNTPQKAKNIQSPIPNKFSLYQNYPNPFNPSTKISFSLPQESFVNISIYNILGHKIRTLVNKTIQPGIHEVVWDGRNNFGQTAGSGIYFYRLMTSKYSQTRKMMLMK